VRQHVVAFHRRQHVAADRWLFICVDLNQKESHLRARRVKGLTRFLGKMLQARAFEPAALVGNLLPTIKAATCRRTPKAISGFP
jgi:hypothetical protein